MELKHQINKILVVTVILMSAIKYLIIPLILFVYFVTLALAIPKVQNAIAGKLASYISTRTGFELTISSIDLNINKGLQLNDILLIDHNRDTLLDAQTLSAGIVGNVIPMLFNRQYKLNAFSVSDGIINITKNKTDSLSNIETFIARLRLPESSESGCTPLSIRRISLYKINFKAQLQDYPYDYDMSFDELKLNFRRFDLCNNRIHLRSVDINKPQFALYGSKYSPDTNSELSESAPTGLLQYNIKIDKIDLNDGEFVLDQFSDQRKPGTRSTFIDFADLEVNSIYFSAKDIELSDSKPWVFVLEKMAFTEKSGFTVENISVEQGVFGNDELGLEGFKLRTKVTDLSSRILLQYNDLNDFKSFVDKIGLRISFYDSFISMSDIAYFIRDYRTQTDMELLQEARIKLNGLIAGTINDFKTDNIELSLQDKILLSSDIQCRNITDQDKMFLNVNNLNIKSTPKFLQQLFPKREFPKQVLNFNNLDFTGSFFGYLKEFNATGFLQTDRGSAEFNLNMDFTRGNDDTRYSGKLLLHDFRLGEIFEDEDLGSLHGQIVIEDGRNVSIETINTEFTARIDSFDYKQYTYRNVNMDGVLNSRTFNGELAVYDRNFNLLLNGVIDYHDSVPIFNFYAEIENADLMALNLTKNKLFVSSGIEIDIRGDKAEDFTGAIRAENLIISDGIETASLDSFSVYSALSNGQRFLDGDSDILSFYFDGKYWLYDLQNSLYSIFNRHFSKFLAGFDDINIEDDPKFADYHYNFNLTIYDSGNFFRVLTGKDIRAKNLSVYGSAYHSNDSIKFEARFDSLIYDKYALSGFSSDFNLYQGLGDFQLLANKLIYDGTTFGNLTLNSDIDRNELYFYANIDSISSVDNSLSFSGRTLPIRDSFQIQIYGGYLRLLNNTYEFTGENRMTIGKKYINFYDFSLSDNLARVSIEAVNKNKGIKLNFENFDSKPINLLIDYDKLDFSGLSKGYVEITDIFNVELFKSEIDIPDFRINGDFWGALKAQVFIDSADKNKLIFNSVIGSTEPILLADGSFDLKQKSMFGDFVLNDYPLIFLEYLLDDAISKTTGSVNANLTVRGPVKEININGKGMVSGGATTVNFLGTRYSFDKQSFSLNNRGIVFTGIEINDEFGNKGKIESGGLTYNRFKDWGVDIRMSSDRIAALNTTKQMNPDFWGFAVGPTRASFKGLFADVVAMEIHTTTAKASNLTIPIKLNVSSEGGSFINFAGHENADQITVQQDQEEGGIQLELYVTINEDATLTLIMDENTGDYLRGNGSGIIKLVMDKDREIDVYGDFRFNQGNYVFKYELWEFGLVTKEFVIRPGSQILWSGDPYNAMMDIKADYRANRVSLHNLLGDMNRITDASYIGDVNLILLLTGSLQIPEINFDFDFQNIDERIRSHIMSKVQVMRSDPNSLYTQAVSLLTFGSFVPDQSLSSLQNEAFFAGGVNTISELITSQLSQYVTSLLREMVLDSKVVSGIDVSFDARYNTIMRNRGQQLPADPGSQNFNMNATLWFYNDRVFVHFGGDYNYGENAAAISPRSNYFSQGSVDIGYIVTRDRRLKLKLSFKTEFRELIADWENNGGIGISYGNEFGRIFKEK
jgi:hypothetical protein